MRKNLGTKPFFYPLPVLIIGSYDEKGKAGPYERRLGRTL